jgi:hypothetical protein
MGFGGFRRSYEKAPCGSTESFTFIIMKIKWGIYSFLKAKQMALTIPGVFYKMYS